MLHTNRVLLSRYWWRMNNFSNMKVHWGPVATTFQKQTFLVVARWLVKYVNRIFSGFRFHSCIANRIRIRISIPTSWIRTGVGIEKNLSPNTSVRQASSKMLILTLRRELLQFGTITIHTWRWKIADKNSNIMNPTTFHSKRTKKVENKKNSSAVNIRFIAKTSTLRNFSRNIRSNIKTSEVATLDNNDYLKRLHWLQQKICKCLISWRLRSKN